MAGSVGPASGEGEVMVEMNTTPLIDVMLVMLVMLIITIPIQTHAVKLDLPQATNAPPPTTPRAQRRARRLLVGDGPLLVGDELQQGGLPLPGGGDAPVERAGLTGVGLPDHPQIWNVQAARYGSGFVGGAVVDDDDLKPPAVLAGRHRLDRGGDACSLVIGRNHHRHIRQVLRTWLRPSTSAPTVRPGESDQHAQPYHG